MINSQRFLELAEEDLLLAELSEAISSIEVPLDRAWELFGFGEKISIKHATKDGKFGSAYVTIQELRTYIKKYPTVYWSPHRFTEPCKTKIDHLYYYQSISLDVDSKIDLYFWTKTKEIFSVWGGGGTYNGIPIPSVYSYSGKGYHPYWHIEPIMVKDDKKLKELMHFSVKLFQYKLSVPYDGNLDNINRIQIFRVPESKTKYGGYCRSFAVKDYKRYNLFDLLKSALTEDEYNTVLAYLNDDLLLEDIHEILAKYAKVVEIPFEVRRRKKEPNIEAAIDKTFSNEQDVFNPKSLGKFYHIIESDEKAKNRGFAYLCINTIKARTPIVEGERDNRLFGLCVALGKCDIQYNNIAKVAHLANESFCDPPLTDREVFNCYCNVYRYIRMRGTKLREYLGIKYWRVFRKHESTMTRKEAAKNASEISHKRSKKRVKDGFSELGFNVPVKKFCTTVDVSRTSYYRYIKDGTLAQIFNWFINICNYASVKDIKLIKLLRGAIYKIGAISSSELIAISDQYFLAVQSRSLAVIP